MGAPRSAEQITFHVGDPVLLEEHDERPTLPRDTRPCLAPALYGIYGAIIEQVIPQTPRTHPWIVSEAVATCLWCGTKRRVVATRKGNEYQFQIRS